MVKDRNWCNQFYRGRFGAFTIVKGCGPVTYYGKGLVAALHSIRSPNAAAQPCKSDENNYRTRLLVLKVKWLSLRINGD